MTRIIVQTIDDMPGKARDGLPLGCVLETDGPAVVAYGEGDTFKEAGLTLLTRDMRTYTAVWPDAAYPEMLKVKVYAADTAAALQWLRHGFNGPFELWVDADPIYLGEFGVEEG